MLNVLPLVVIGSEKLSASDLCLRAVGIGEYIERLRQDPEFSDAILEISGWPAHLQDLVDAIVDRGLQRRYAAVLSIGVEEYQRQLRDAVSDGCPYARAYPNSSWCYVKGLGWSAKIAQELGVWDNEGRYSEQHLEGVDKPDHPYYQKRRDLIDEYRRRRGGA